MRQFLRDNWEEFVCGFVLGLGFCLALHLGWQGLLLCFACAILWKLGGSGWLGTKAWRRVGIPVILVGVNHSLPLISRMVAAGLTFGMLTMGYGTRSTQPPDEGSPFGNWCLKVAGSELWGKVLARGIIIVAIWITFGVAYGLEAIR